MGAEEPADPNQSLVVENLALIVGWLAVLGAVTSRLLASVGGSA